MTRLDEYSTATPADADQLIAIDASDTSAAAAGTVKRFTLLSILTYLANTFASLAQLTTHEADTTSVHGITDTSTLYRAGGTDVALADGGTGASLTDPNADRILFWDDSAGATAFLTPGTGLTITTTTIDVTRTINRQLSWYEDGTLTAATSKGPLRRIDAAVTLTGAYLSIKTAPTGAALIVDIKRSTTGPDGTFTTIFSSLPQIAISAFSGNSTSLSITTLAAGDIVRMDITQIGSTIAGASLTVDLNMTAS